MAEKLKRFFTNKNTVTIIGLFLIIGILYFVYSSRIKEATNPVLVPVAKQTIQPKTLITKDMIEYKSVPRVAVDKNNTITNSAGVIGKYSNYNTMIPKGSMFFADALITKDSLPDMSLIDVGENEVLYNFPVDMKTSYQNSIMPGTKVDIYMKALNDQKVLMVGRLLENVNVLAVKDSNGQNVFENTSEKRTPAYIFFGVTPEVHILLRKASYLTNYQVVLFPVPSGKANTTEAGETRVTTDELKDFINSHTVALVENTIIVDEGVAENNNSETGLENNDNNNLSYDENGNLVGA